MPARVSGIFPGRESDRKASQSVTRQPPSLSAQFIQSSPQPRSICRLPKRFFSLFPEPNHRFGPSRPITRIAAGILPEYFPRPRGQIPRKRAFQPDEPLLYELFIHARVIPLADQVSNSYKSPYRLGGHRLPLRTCRGDQRPFVILVIYLAKTKFHLPTICLPLRLLIRPLFSWSPGFDPR